MTLEELKIRQMTNQYLLSPSDKLTVAAMISTRGLYPKDL